MRRRWCNLDSLEEGANDFRLRGLARRVVRRVSTVAVPENDLRESNGRLVRGRRFCSPASKNHVEVWLRADYRSLAVGAVFPDPVRNRQP